MNTAKTPHPSAWDATLPFGKYGPKHPDGPHSLGQLTTSSEGLSYLDWLCNFGWSEAWREASRQTLAGEPVVAPTEIPTPPQRTGRGKRKRGKAEPKVEPKAEPEVEPTSSLNEERVREIAVEEITTAGEGTGEELSREIVGHVTDKVQKMIDAAIAAVRPDHFIVERAELPDMKIEGVAHKQLQDIIDLTSQRVNVLMIGPAGCGKTFLAEQLANVMGLRFGSCSLTAGASESHLTGRLIPIGDHGRFMYVAAEFVEYYENGGVFLLDEVDAADPNMLLVINQAIANGRLPLPNRVVVDANGKPDLSKAYAVKHPDFICMAAANTYGTGENRQYVGRNQLDDASLDRFRMGQVEMDYDREIERALVESTELLDAVWKVRDTINANASMRRIASTRFLLDAQKMMAQGWDVDKCIGQLVTGWTEDEKSKVGRGRFSPASL